MDSKPVRQIEIPMSVRIAASKTIDKGNELGPAMAMIVITAVILGACLTASVIYYPEDHSLGLAIGTIFGIPAFLPLIAALGMTSRAWKNRHLARVIRDGGTVDPSCADQFDVEAVRIVGAAGRFNKAAAHWNAYARARLADEKEPVDEALRTKKIPNETAVRASLVAEGLALQGRVDTVNREFSRRERKAELTQLAEDAGDESSDDILLNHQDPSVQPVESLDKDATDMSQVDVERLLAEPIALANLDALDKELATHPSRARTTNG